MSYTLEMVAIFNKISRGWLYKTLRKINVGAWGLQRLAVLKVTFSWGQESNFPPTPKRARSAHRGGGSTKLYVGGVHGPALGLLAGCSGRALPGVQGRSSLKLSRFRHFKT